MPWNPTPDAWRAPVSADGERYDPSEVFAAGLLNHHVANTAYPIAHQQTFKPYRVTKSDHNALVSRGFADIRDLCLYVHVPFCETRCSFCEYTVVGKAELDQTDVYVDALLRELDHYDGELSLGSRRIFGLDIGGGTPGYLSAAQVERILAAIHARVTFEQVFGPEISFVVERNLMAWRDDALALTPDGVHFYNGIIPLFAAPSIQRYLLDRDPHKTTDMARNRDVALRTAGGHSQGL